MCEIVIRLKLATTINHNKVTTFFIKVQPLFTPLSCQNAHHIQIIRLFSATGQAGQIRICNFAQKGEHGGGGS